MDKVEEIKSLAKEAEVYRRQGLLKQSKQIFVDVLGRILKHKRLCTNQNLITFIEERILTIEKNISAAEALDPPELSGEIQNFVHKLFPFSENDDTATGKGPPALTKLSQYEKALEKSGQNTDGETQPILIAMNILRSHLDLHSPQSTVEQLKKWGLHSEFSESELKYLREFLEKTLQEKGLETDLSPLDNLIPEEEIGKEEQKIFETSSVRIQLKRGTRKGAVEEFDIKFQSGNKIEVIIPSERKDLIAIFRPGCVLQKIQCYAEMSLFNSRGIVSKRKRIADGPKRGDYSMAIAMNDG